MIVLDTNVLSELMRRSPDAGVIRWLDEQAAELVWTTALLGWRNSSRSDRCEPPPLTEIRSNERAWKGRLLTCVRPRGRDGLSDSERPGGQKAFA